MLQPLIGLIALTLFAWLLSEKRSTFPWKLALAGIASQLLLALILLKLPAAQELFLAMNRAILAIQDATAAGSQFVFGYLGGGEPPFEARPGISSFVLAFQALPIILLMSALSALLFHWRILPWLVRGSPGHCNGRSELAERLDLVAPPTYLSVWWKPPCSSAPTLNACRAPNCSR